MKESLSFIFDHQIQGGGYYEKDSLQAWGKKF